MSSSITKSARYTETCLKLLASFDETVTSEDQGQLYTVLVAHKNFLQSEYVGLVVKGQFDWETTTVFKCLQKNTTCFKAAYSVTFDLLILELMFLFFKNTVKN